jgi:hypothetical protein
VGCNRSTADQLQAPIHRGRYDLSYWRPLNNIVMVPFSEADFVRGTVVKRGSLTEVTNALLRLVKTAKYSGNTNYSDKKFLILHKPDETRAPLTETAVNKNGRSPGSSL